jgi:hypothetical protein
MYASCRGRCVSSGIPRRYFIEGVFGLVCTSEAQEENSIVASTTARAIRFGALDRRLAYCAKLCHIALRATGCFCHSFY